MTAQNRACRPALMVLAAVAMSVAGPIGCATAPLVSYRAERYRIEVWLDPATHELVGRSTIDLSRTGPRTMSLGHPVALELKLHPHLEITGIRASGVGVHRRHRRTSVRDDGDDFQPRSHTIVLSEPVDSLTLFVEYRGDLVQDVSAGEVPGQIHNFKMRAHIGRDGIFLGDGYWYPQPAADKRARRALASYTLIADPVPDFALVAGAVRDDALSELTGRLAWRSPYPVDGMVLVGGPHVVQRNMHRDVDIGVHLKPAQAMHANGLMEAIRRNLERYEPLIGPYPGSEFTIVDNFFSSGFAFPTFTLLSSAVIDMGRRSQTAHGYLDHEMLHCWWGNGIHVDPRDGNWCEALASYAANYYGYVLDGDEEGARLKRRNYCHFLSRIEAKRDKPLGTYGLENGCGRGIAYHKGAMVFHMLARQVGQDRFWATMRRFTDEYVGRYASWNELRRLLEEESGQNLATFFHQWVRSGSAPTIAVESARYHSADQTLTVVLTQGEPAFDLSVPLRVTHADGVADVEIPLSVASEEVTIPVNIIPLAVEADPDYHIFRRIPKKEIIPTTAATRHGTAFAVVTPQGDLADEYASVKSIFESSFDANERVAVTAGAIEEGALAERCVLVVGEAVRDPYMAAFLSAIEFPVRWNEHGFEFQGTSYEDPADAILCTSRHPGVGGGGVTVFFGNSEAALPSARNVPMYEHSTIVFRDGKPIVRHDAEQRILVQVDKS